MSRLSDLVRQVAASDPQLAKDIQAEVKALERRREFGLNFERHTPESVDLYGRPVRRGDKVRILPPRGESDPPGRRRLWEVRRVRDGVAELTAPLVEPASEASGVETNTAPVDDLVVVAEHRDRIYPGLVSTGRVERGGADKPFHTVINAENFHALEALAYTHEGKVDAIYIDPPYNTGAKDWKYNNDYVDSEDAYRHSKWLAFMERRLKLAKRLLNPENSVLIVTIDEKEYLRLGLLLQQTFPEAALQMISSVINPSGAKRDNLFSRSDEYIFVLTNGSAAVRHPRGDGIPREVRWWYLRRTDITSKRGTVKGGTSQFYPIYVDRVTERIVHLGDPLSPDDPLEAAPQIAGAVAVFPIREDGTHMNWGLTAPTLRRLLDRGLVRVTRGHDLQPFIFTYISEASLPKITSGRWAITGERPDGSKIVVSSEGKVTRATTAWRYPGHDAGQYGTSTLGALLPGRRFPFPKSLYAVEDALRFFVADKPGAVVLDFFAGSGTTAHAVMRLNKQDGGRRQCISVTNNEVSAEEQKSLRAQGLRPGDPEWEQHGICDYITKPRIEAAITGQTPEGEPIKGDYKFTDEFPMSDGFEENAEFFTLTYEDPLRIEHHRSFDRIAPLLWMKAGAQGRRIEEQPAKGYAVADTYAILFDLDAAREFLDKISTGSTGADGGGVRMVFVLTDDDRAFQRICAELPAHVATERLYGSYLTRMDHGPQVD